jgi:hypothetical protein
MLVKNTSTRKKKDKKQECLYEFQLKGLLYKPPRILPFFMELGTNNVRSIAINPD